MYLRTLDIHGFKCFGEPFTIEFHDGLNVLVGENGAGKTGVVAAVRQLFNDSESGKRLINERDFHRGFHEEAVTAQRIDIQATFSDLDENDAIAFRDWCGNEEEAKLTFTALNLESRGRFKSQLYGGYARATALETETLDLIHCIYLPPLRDAETKLRDGRQSRLARLLKALCRKELDIARKEGKPHPLEERVGAFNQELSASDDYAIKQANERIGNSLRAALGMHLSQNTHIQFSEVSFSRIVEGLRLLYFPSLAAADATQFRSLEENSLGYNNLLYIASILAELTLEVEEERGEETYLRLLLIEEPEAHLHPQLQIRLLKHLSTVAKEKSIQVIVTTHSTVISSAVSVDEIIHLSNKCTPVAIPLRTCGLPESSRKFIDRWLDVTKSNLLFSKGSILVEGIAEAMVIPELARRVLAQYGDGENTLEDYGVSVINLGGIYFKHFMQLFCDVTDESAGENVPVRCAGLTDKDPPKTIKIDVDGGKQMAVEYMPNDDDLRDGENHALAYIAKIGQSQFGRLYAGKYKTFEYDIAMEGANLQMMLSVAADLWPAQDGTVAPELREKAKLTFDEMKSPERAGHAAELLYRIDSTSIGKGIYAQAFAEELEKQEGIFVVPAYIRDAILWACGLEEPPLNDQAD
ncbi:ATP-dependent nuclease [Pseudomonas syringae]|uniref:ATP-dependent nuclease n=1 Tax=Pseudomonas syringae TaxID=317 RepID=UPI000CD36533|nr:AAA family ATPase [Pseudomonas syringae]MCF5196438.1 AAA family ATPase [Pseudomonas syringae]MCF5211310.1 AAA family ATPase [Pseudomonas syringae]MCF5212192.1 AAA family ATPase [Pseudomonas syringae]MCF5220068.1 AAA family ATPase [Pseudomonas syringae]MCF5268526.1 AAA family ATPase [Pseudomonas syringae]